MNRNRNQHQRYSEIARKFLRSPTKDTVAAVVANVVPTEDPVADIYAALKGSEHCWDTTPLLLAHCVHVRGFHPTLQNPAEYEAINAAYAGLSAATQAILSNNTDITVELRDTFLTACRDNICKFYGRDDGRSGMLNVCAKKLAKFPEAKRKYDSEDLLQDALEKLIDHFPKLFPESYGGILVRTIGRLAKDAARRKTKEDPTPIDLIPEPVYPKSTEDQAIIREALVELKIAIRNYLGELEQKTNRSRFRKLAVILLYELGDANISQEALAVLINCSPQSILNWRSDYLNTLPPVFSGLKEVW